MSSVIETTEQTFRMPNIENQIKRFRDLHFYNTINVSHRLMKSCTHTSGLHAHLNPLEPNTGKCNTGEFQYHESESRQVVMCKDNTCGYLDKPK